MHKIIKILCLLLFLAISTPNHAYNQNKPGQGPRLPEPMVFDLVLPLGAKKGEYEFNTLSQYNLRHKSTDVNPEFEYAYAKGHGVEFELPTHNSVTEAYKLSLQGTFNFLNTDRFIHGWQYIGEYHRKDKGYENDLLYLFGYQFNEKWSTLNMTGFRLADIKSKGVVDGLLNGNIFYTFSNRFLLGLEINWEARTNLSNIVLFMPQVHVYLAKHAKLQFGFGLQHIHHHNTPHAGARIIFGF